MSEVAYKLLNKQAKTVETVNIHQQAIFDVYLQNCFYPGLMS